MANDFTLRYKNRRYQILKEEAKGIRPGDKITVELRVDGSTHFRWKTRYLSPRLIEAHNGLPMHVSMPRRPKPKPVSPPIKDTGKKVNSAPRRPAADHPWRRSKIGRGPKDFTPGKVKTVST